MDILKCPLLIGESLKNSSNGLGSCNFQVTEQIYETIKACSVNRKLCNFIDIVNTYLYWPKPDSYFLFFNSFLTIYASEVPFICMFIHREPVLRLCNVD